MTTRALRPAHSRSRSNPTNPADKPSRPSRTAAEEAAAAPIDATLVPHTHWDREWHQPFEVFRSRLVRMVDELLELLAREPDAPPFMLDGQTIILEDYLALRSERADEVRGHIASGRLLVGPWHVLADEFLVGAESLVRNLLLGWQVSRRFGRRMDVGYLPDMFGHIGQLPQILRLSGMDTAVVWRGLSHEPSELWWEAPDGTRVLALYLRDGYNVSGHLPVDAADLARALRRQIASLAEHAVTHHVLLMSGDDHAGPQSGLPARLAEVSAALHDIRVRAGSLPEFVTVVRRELGLDTTPEAVPRDGLSARMLPVVRGELRSPRRAPLLAGVASARIPLKQANAAVETLLTSYAEPLAAISQLLDGRGRRAELWQAWRTLIENHAHDSICGCSVDPVHEEMAARFASSAQIAGTVVDDGLAALARRAGRPDRAAASQQPRDGLRLHDGCESLSVTVFNPAARQRVDRAVVEMPSLLPGRTYRLLDPDGRPVPMTAIKWNRRRLADRDLDGDDMCALLDQIDSGWLTVGRVKDARLRIRRRGADRTAGNGPGFSAQVDLELVELGQADLPAIRRFTNEARSMVARGVDRWQVRTWVVGQAQAAFVAQAVPGLGYATYRLESVAVRHAPPNPRPRRQAGEPNVLENEFLRVEANPVDGTLSLLDKRIGLRLCGLNRFVDNGDRGDTYTHCPPEADRVIDRPAAPASITVIDEGPLGGRLEIGVRYAIPARLGHARRRRSTASVQLALVSSVRLVPGVPRVDIETTVENRAQDHRLRVHFPVPFAVDRALADSVFDVVSRPTAVPTETAGWVERPVGAAPQGAFVALAQAGRGLLVANRGLPEYEVIEDDAGATVALTLLRCVGWLSRDDLDGCRSLPAGPSLPTPGAQCPGRHTFAYSLIPFEAALSRAIQEAHAYRAPLRAIAAPAGDGSLPARLSFVELAPDDLVLSAVKPADDGDGWIVRFWNAADRPIPAGLRLGVDIASAERVDLLEESLEVLHVEAPRAISLSVGAKEIISLRVRPVLPATVARSRLL